MNLIKWKDYGQEAYLFQWIRSLLVRKHNAIARAHVWTQPHSHEFRNLETTRKEFLTIKTCLALNSKYHVLAHDEASISDILPSDFFQ